MQYTILLDRQENTKQVEAQEQARFVYSIIEAMELPIDWNPDDPLTVENKIKLCREFDKYNLSVIDDTDGNIKVFANNELIGEWYKSTYKVKSDFSKPDPKKRIYLEMAIHFWAKYEEQNAE